MFFTCICVYSIAAEVKEERTAPDFTTQLEDIHTTDGGQAVLECVITGFPRPSVTWLKDDVLVEESEEFKILYDEDNVCSLTIPDVYPEDAGRYTVVAKNELGSAMSTAELFVESKNQIRYTAVARNATGSAMSMADFFVNSKTN